MCRTDNNRGERKEWRSIGKKELGSVQVAEREGRSERWDVVEKVAEGGGEEVNRRRNEGQEQEKLDEG